MTPGVGESGSADGHLSGPAGWRTPRWAAPVTLVLAGAGIAVASYLTYAHYTDPKVLACSDKGVINCAKVTTSAQSRFLGMPVAVLGLAYFVAMAAACSPWLWRRPERFVRLARLAAVTGGLAMVLYLLYAELFIIDAICLYCTVVHGLTLLMFIAVTSATVVGTPTRSALLAELDDDFDDDVDDGLYDEAYDADDPAAGAGQRLIAPDSAGRGSLRGGSRS